MNQMALKGIILGGKHGIKQNITHKTPWALIDPTLATIMSIKHDVQDVTGKNGPGKQRGTLYEMGSDLGMFLGKKPFNTQSILEGWSPPKAPQSNQNNYLNYWMSQPRANTQNTEFEEFLKAALDKQRQENEFSSIQPYMKDILDQINKSPYQTSLW